CDPTMQADLGSGELPRAVLGLPQRLYELARSCGACDSTVPPDRLSRRVCDCAHARRVAAAPALSRDAAVLDELSDPRLCLDRDPAAERPRQPAAACGRSHRAAVA